MQISGVQLHRAENKPFVRHVFSRLQCPDEVERVVDEWLVQCIPYLENASIRQACSCGKLIRALALLAAESNAVSEAVESFCDVPAT